MGHPLDTVLYVPLILRLSQTNALHCVKSVFIQSFFWSVFSCIRTEYQHLPSGSPYSVRMRENTDQKNSECGHFSRIATLFLCYIS